VLSGIGLSGFFFSTLAHFLFPGNTSSFLLLLSLGTALTTIIGFFLVRPIPLSAAEGSDHMVVTTVAAEAEATIFDHGNDSHTPLLDEATDFSPTEEYYVPDARGIELGPPSRPSAGRSRRTFHSRTVNRSKQQDVFEGPNIYGRALWINPDFWLLFVILSLRALSVSVP
jgi:hypothetical protein